LTVADTFGAADVLDELLELLELLLLEPHAAITTAATTATLAPNMRLLIKVNLLGWECVRALC
jgi:hypothetical protein